MAGIKLSNVRNGSKRYEGMKLVIDNREQTYDVIVALLDEAGVPGGGKHWYNWIAVNCVMEDGSPIVSVVNAPRKRRAPAEVEGAAKTEGVVEATPDELSKLVKDLKAAADAAPEDRPAV